MSSIHDLQSRTLHSDDADMRWQRRSLPYHLVTGRSPEEVEGPAEEIGGPPGLVVSHTMDPSSATVDSFKARVTLLYNNWCLKLHFFIDCEGGALRPAHNVKK